MKKLYMLQNDGWILINEFDEEKEVVIPVDGIYRIEEIIEGGSTIIFETKI